MDEHEEYYIKDIRGRTMTTFEVAKFNFRRYPEAIYNVARTKVGWRCSCVAHLSYGRQCKHIEMVKEWIKKGMPSPFARFEPTKAEIDELWAEKKPPSQEKSLKFGSKPVRRLKSASSR